MKRLLLQIGFILLIGTLLQWWLPWWIIVPVCWLAAFIWPMSAGFNFINSFILMGSIWLCYAYGLNMSQHGLLAGRIGELFGGLSAGWMMISSALLGALVAGLAAWNGGLVRQLFRQKTMASS